MLISKDVKVICALAEHLVWDQCTTRCSSFKGGLIDWCCTCYLCGQQLSLGGPYATRHTKHTKVEWDADPYRSTVAL